MTEEQIKRLYLDALSLGLDIPDGMTIDDFVAAYNGTGAEWMPEGIRDFLDNISEPLLPAVGIHDTEYELGDGTRGHFYRANERLRRNGRICADANAPWWHLRRYRLRKQAKIFASLCDQFGWSAYLAAIRERQEREEIALELDEQNQIKK